MKRVLLIIKLILVCGILKAQNLLPNPSFENLKNGKPSMYPWQMINTVDFFVYSEEAKNQTLKTKITDKNFRLRPARTGKAYVGLRVWRKYREFLIVKLNSPLEKESRYLFEMYCMPSAHANCLLRSMGLSAYPVKPPYSQEHAFYNFPPQIVFFKKEGIGRSNDWEKVSGVFEAKGGERYITIGNFSTSNKDKLIRRHFSLRKREAYYYIDDLALYKLDNYGYPIISEQQIAEFELETLLDKNDTLDANVLYVDYIHFPLGSYKLNNESFAKLDFIKKVLFENQDSKVVLTGYTFDGEKDYLSNRNLDDLLNKRLSQVYDYLLKDKIHKKRIETNYVKLSDNQAESNYSPYLKITIRKDVPAKNEKN